MGLLDDKAVARVVGCLPHEGPATIDLDGPGGYVQSLFSLLTALHEYRGRGHVVTCIVTKEATSANVFLLESPECDVRVMSPGAKIGLHHLEVQVQGPAPWVVAAVAKVMEHERFLFKMVADRIDHQGGTDDTIKTLTDLIDADDAGWLYLDSGLAVGMGLADKVSK